MADTKISALPASTTPLAGTEVLPIVQGGATKQVSVANLTAGRAISALGLTVSGLTASTALALNASKEAVSVTNTGTGDNVLATSPTLVTPVIGAATGTSLVTTSQVTSQKTATTTQIQSVGLQAYFNPGNIKTFTITPGSGLAWAFVISEGNGGGGALVFCSYKNTTINIVSASVGARSFVASNSPGAFELGIYKSADSSVINFVSGATWGAAVAICLLGDFIGTVTDPV
jgi:hypothetical protein